MQLGEGDIDHSTVFSSMKISSAKRNYSTTEREGLEMVYALHKYRHYRLGGHFIVFTDHSTLKYMFNKPVLGGNIFRWIMLFQEYNFEIIVKPGRLNARPDHLSQIENGEEPTSLEEGLRDAQLFSIKVVEEHFVEIIHFLTMGMVPVDYSV